jgi:hypothetical protein
MFIVRFFKWRGISPGYVIMMLLNDQPFETLYSCGFLSWFYYITRLMGGVNDREE